MTFIHPSGYLSAVCPSSLIAIVNQNATYPSIISVILNPDRIAAHDAVVNLIIMPAEQIVYLQINLKNFKAEVARDQLVN